MINTGRFLAYSFLYRYSVVLHQRIIVKHDPYDSYYNEWAAKAEPLERARARLAVLPGVEDAVSMQFLMVLSPRF